LLREKVFWGKKRAQNYSSEVKKGSKGIYVAFAEAIRSFVPFEDVAPVALDLGSGPGFLTVELMRLYPWLAVIAADPSKAMLDEVRRNAEKVGATDVLVCHGCAEAIPLSDGSIDLVVNQFSLHEWQEPLRGLTEVFRVLKTGGSLLLEDFNRNYPESKLIEQGATAGCLASHARAIALDDLEMLLDEAGFTKALTEERARRIFVHASK